MSNQLATLLESLKGTQNSESLPAEIRELIYVQRQIPKTNSTLEDILIRELSKGRSLIIAGSAGGGKTMLIEHLSARLKALNVNIPEEQIIPDLTAIDGDRSEIVRTVVNKGQYIVAANEGILRNSKMIEVLPQVWETIKKLQLGTEVHEANYPIVVDIAGFDPIESSLEGIFLNESIQQALKLNEIDCPENSESVPCSRLDSLDLLDERMSKMVTSLVIDAIGPGEVTYRDLWNFVRDIFLGGNCSDSLIESTWFWRLFYSRNKISRKLLEYHRPNFLSLPEISPLLYRGDWEKVQSLIGETGYTFIYPGQAPSQIEDKSLRNQTQIWLKIQTALIMRANGSKYPIFMGETSGDLEKRILKQNKIELLVQMINAYFRREKIKDQNTSLELWMDFSTERRSKRPLNLIKLGEFPKRDLSLKKSLVVANIDDFKFTGNRAYLSTNYDDSGVLELSSELFDALLQGRPISTARRKYDDVDNALRRFFLEIYNSKRVEDGAVIGLLTPGTSEGLVELSWRIGSDLSIERIGT